MPCLETGSHLCGKIQAVSIRHSWKVGTSWGWSQSLQKFPDLPAPTLQTRLLTPSRAPSHQATKRAKRRTQEGHFRTRLAVFGIYFFAALQNHGTVSLLSPEVLGSKALPRAMCFPPQGAIPWFHLA